MTKNQCQTTNIENCNNCKSMDSKHVASNQDFEYMTCNNQFNFVECLNCGLIYLKNRPKVEELDRIYPKEYIPYHFQEHLGSFINKLRNIVQKKKIAPFLKHGDENAIILDIGCGSGELLNILKKHGKNNWELWGVDFSETAINNLQNLGINGISSRIEDLHWEDTSKKPNIIIMNQVIEHVDNPDFVIKKCYDLLAPNGVLIVETPSCDSWDGKLFKKKYWGGYHTPRHWNLYTPNSLGYAFKKNGFSVIETTHILSPNFWLQSMHHLIRFHYKKPKIAKMFDVNNLFFLSIASGIDIFQKILTRKTSNFRMIGRKNDS